MVGGFSGFNGTGHQTFWLPVTRPGRWEWEQLGDLVEARRRGPALGGVMESEPLPRCFEAQEQAGLMYGEMQYPLAALLGMRMRGQRPGRRGTCSSSRAHAVSARPK